MLKKLINKETISYLIFGILTTLINIIAYRLCTALGMVYWAANIVAWTLSVLFAFITNKLFVFRSKNTDKKIIIKEFTTFVAARIFSGGCDMAFMIISVEILHINDFIAKLFTNVFVVVVNYVFSKLFIFKNLNIKEEHLESL